MNWLEKAGIAALHRMDPERAHDLSLRALRAGVVPLQGGPITSDHLRLTLAGMELPNPIGLAAGYDKNARAVGALMRAGFGFIEVGAATPRPQPGNPKPRVFRLTEDRAIINRFGFNNDGVAAIGARLASRPAGIPVGLNIGANKDSADRAADFAQVVRAAGESADFLTVNVSSPNTEKLRDLQGRDVLAALLDRVMSERNRLARQPPVFVKIAPDLSADEIADIAAVIRETAVQGIIATNTTLSRDRLMDRQAKETGGLSGAPLFDRSTHVLALLFRETRGEIPLIGVGGVATADQAWEKLCAGASALQIYSALIFKGFSVAADIAKAIDARLKKERITLAELSGSKVADY